ncbi:MAG: hypothetical protein AB7Q81_23325 [Gammaproteobacteria bacterium]
MQLRTDLALHAAINSLTKVVLPAVDAANGPAQEQLQIVIGLLSLLTERLPLEYAFDRDELERALVFAEGLLAMAPEDLASEHLAAAAVDARGVLDGARSAPHDLQRAVRALRECSGAMITALHGLADATQREALGALVLAHQREQLTRERAWLLPQGWEAEPNALPAIATLLGPDARPS